MNFPQKFSPSKLSLLKTLLLCVATPALLHCAEAQTASALGSVGAVSIAHPSGSSELPDAPLPSTVSETGIFRSQVAVKRPVVAWSSNLDVETFPELDATENSPAMESRVTPHSQSGYVPLNDCPTDETRARECRMHWKPMLLESALFNAFENGGNLYTGYWYRWETIARQMVGPLHRIGCTVAMGSLVRRQSLPGRLRWHTR